MKLTKQQRHIAYIIMLAEAELTDMVYTKIVGADKNRNNYPYEKCGFCFLLKQLFDMDLHDGQFTELINKRPQFYYSAFWFKNEDSESRIKILKQCIAETY